mgnify:CR=1 FL=1
MRPLCPLAARICEVYDFPPVMFAPPAPPPPTAREIEQARRAELLRRNEAILNNLRAQAAPTAPDHKMPLPSGSLGLIIRLAATRFGVSAHDLISKSRKVAFQAPRRAVVMIARDRLDLSYPQMARHFGRDHTSMIHAEKMGYKMLADDDAFARAFARLQGDVSKVMGRKVGQSPELQIARHDAIKARARREPIQNIANDFGLSEGRVKRIARIGQ